MVKIYHEHVARVMQRALAVFRRYNAGETVSSICGSRGGSGQGTGNEVNPKSWTQPLLFIWKTRRGTEVRRWTVLMNANYRKLNVN